MNALNELLGLSVEPQDLTLPQLIARAFMVFVAALVMLRVAHKRFFARRNAMDVLLTFVLASTLARAINGSAAFFPTLGAGFFLVLLHRGATFMAARSPAFGRLLKGDPVTLINEGKIDDAELRRRSMSRQDMEEDLRINGVSDVERVERAVLERNGAISVCRASRVYTIAVERGVQHVRIEMG